MKRYLAVLLLLYSPLTYSAGITLTEKERIVHKSAMDEMMRTMHDPQRWEMSAKNGGQCIIGNNVTIAAGTEYEYKGVNMRCVLFYSGEDIGKRELFILMPVRVAEDCEKRNLTRRRGSSQIYSKCVT